MSGRMRERFVAHLWRNANGECLTRPLDEHLNAVTKLGGVMEEGLG
jgi:hypothetical protein